ncbi:ATP-grasp domain-containing protein [Streptomyces sp. NPDC005438]|uniref:ATP-grasp domain-containing protein n=1 Tax=Streptomyces sp. NPDC005438 TaxID=3156880 RepID=UPI0033AE6355
MSTESRHVLLVCSAPRHPSPALLEHPAVGRLSVVTEHGHVHDYGPRVAVETVEDIGDVEGVRRAAARLFAHAPVDAVLAPYETGLPSAAYVRSYYGLPGMGYEAANLFTNKCAMKARLTAAGLALAPFRAVYGPQQARVVAERLGWPCVVKPAFGGGSKGVAVLEDAEELGTYLAADGCLDSGMPLVLEAFVPMEAEYHVDALVEDGEPGLTVASRYIGPQLDCGDLLTGSYALPDAHPERAALVELHHRVVRALGMETGVTHLEVFRTVDGRLLVSEIACRPAGGPIPRMLRLRHGVDVWDAHVRACLGLPLGARPRPEPEGYAVNYLLPVRPGRITELSRAEELLEVDGVCEVEMQYGPGDLVPPALYSASASGTVQARVGTEAEVAELTGRLERRFRLRTKPWNGVR